MTLIWMIDQGDTVPPVSLQWCSDYVPKCERVRRSIRRTHCVRLLRMTQKRCELLHNTALLRRVYIIMNYEL